MMEIALGAGGREFASPRPDWLVRRPSAAMALGSGYLKPPLFVEVELFERSHVLVTVPYRVISYRSTAAILLRSEDTTGDVEGVPAGGRQRLTAVRIDATM